MAWCLIAVTLGHAQQDKLSTLNTMKPGMAMSSKATLAPPMGMVPQVASPHVQEAVPTAKEPHDLTSCQGSSTIGTTVADSLHYKHNPCPSPSCAPRVYPVSWPYHYLYGGMHQGLNVSLSLSAFAMFGKRAPSGAGLAQNINATWLQPLGKRAWVAAGGYLDHINWNGNSYTSGGLYGQLGYQFDEHWAGYIYGQKSIVNDGIAGCGYYWGRGLYGMLPSMYNGLSDKLGATVRWTPNPTLSIEVSVEKNWYPNTRTVYPDRYKYNYPSPK